MSSINVRKARRGAGAEVNGVDLPSLSPPRAFAEIRGAPLDHLVPRFRERVSGSQLLAFSRLFGELDPPGPNPYGKPFLPIIPR